MSQFIDEWDPSLLSEEIGDLCKKLSEDPIGTHLVNQIVRGHRSKEYYEGFITGSCNVMRELSEDNLREKAYLLAILAKAYKLFIGSNAGDEKESEKVAAPTSMLQVLQRKGLA